MSNPALELTLIEVTRLADKPAMAGGRIPFSLLFRGPMEPVLHQQIYQVSVAQGGTWDMFLVPIGPDDNGMCYESIYA